jgi:phage terminase large subunit-like protein
MSRTLDSSGKGQSLRERLGRYAADPAAFRDDLLIEQNGELIRLGEVLEPWQDADFRATDPGWMLAAGLPPANSEVRQRAWLERSRGHSKTSDLAVSLAWFLAFARKPVRAFAAAADRDQARLLRDAIARLIRNNPWLGQALDVQVNVIRNIAPGSPGGGAELQILSADVGSSYGILPDAIVLDEITHWPQSGEDLWASLISSAAKRPSCFLQVITNAGAGAGTSWQWGAREEARQSTDWHFANLDGPQASWITEKVLAEQRRLLPAKTYQRLWLNQWSTGGGALSGSDIEACISLEAPMLAREPGLVYLAGLDLGISRDHSSLVVVGADRKANRVKLAVVKSWQPPFGGKIDLQLIQDEILRLHKLFALKRVLFDPYQAELMAQQLGRAGLTMESMAFTGANLNRMASCLVEAVQSHRLELYREKQLIADLQGLNIVPKSYGLRLEAARNKETGHSDRATALAIVLPAALDEAGRKAVDLKAWFQVQEEPSPAVNRVVAMMLRSKSETLLVSGKGREFEAVIGGARVHDSSSHQPEQLWDELVKQLKEHEFVEPTDPPESQPQAAAYRLTERGRRYAESVCRSFYF